MSARAPLVPGDPRHGKYTTYGNHGCRCDLCRAGWAAYVAQQQARRAARGLAPDDPRHGRASTYGNWKCRCPACTRAWCGTDSVRYRRRRSRRAKDVEP